MNGIVPIDDQNSSFSKKKLLFLSVIIKLSLAIRDVRGKPIKTFVEAFTGCCACRLNEPVALADGVESKLVSYFCGGHGVWQILFVGKN